MRSLSEFLDVLSPAFDLITDIVSYRIFGIPVYLVLLNILFVGVVIRFITNGAPGLSSQVSSAANESRAFNKAKNSQKG